ncbi:Iron regulated 1 protein [Heracleum sosnowskyi]|uniref:Iron regulated 1 protein n=1 Tax=Heracleum sosnowskyi TaxID=360622 RepID=A0AAD8GV27_9APIA|nr:Iron regulated 1 protein [Heracleum sosnowskyi]
MAKSLISATKLQQISRIVTSNHHHHHHRPKLTQPFSTVVPSPEPTKPKSIKIEPEKQKLKMDNNNNNNNKNNYNCSPVIEERYPLAAVVNDCVRRWFLDTLKEAKAGDTTMQVLVGQMYNSGYGVTMNAHKGNAWIERASRSRSSARKVGDKRPGYNASDSDSDNVNAEA